jgi:enoyl-CoA hydratase/carnithine racemase
MTDKVTIECAGHVAHVRLNRPDKLNALDPAMFEGLNEAPARVRSMDDVRAVVLSGAGSSFCAGLDVSSFLSAPGFAERAFEPVPDTAANVAQYAALGLRSLDVPVVAAVTGRCFGGGLQIALGADFRFASPDAQLSVMEIKWGIVPDMGITQTLRDLLPLDQAKELAMTGRVVDAAEAQRLGLVTRVCDDPVAEALAFAGALAERSPDAISGIKTLFDGAWHADAAEALALEASTQKSLLGHPAQMEAARAVFEKRAPVFAPRRRS